MDVSIGGAQEGLMLPPGMSFNAISDKAIEASKTSKLPKSFFAWEDMLNMNKIGFFPYTPGTQRHSGPPWWRSRCCTRKASTTHVSARHDRLAEATRRAVKTWGLEILCKDPKYYSSTVTAVLLPEGHNADQFRELALNNFNISYGMSSGPYLGKYLRIGSSRRHQRTDADGWPCRDRDGAKVAGIPHTQGRRAGRARTILASRRQQAPRIISANLAERWENQPLRESLPRRRESSTP